MTILEARDVTKTYDTGGETITALDDVDLGVEPGEFVSIVGPSGSGKTTLLNVLGLLDVPTTGAVALDGEDVTELTARERTDARRETLGFVFQEFHLVSTLTARENVAMPQLFHRDERDDDLAAGLLDWVGLGDRLDHRPKELSGGQKQRVAIARSLINEPRVILADEPTGNLDRDTGRRILDVFSRVSDLGIAIVTVTHDELVNEYVDRTVEIVDGRFQ